ncbi:MAG: dihydroorotate dehydrogenase [Marinilabiliaceae bacterium]|jgi:dihydroorotate dehydrogenase (NAD+) catalytic subunit|nr:dihydroorotate dehydrogenase [Marinilabiliaceae bacterium]
MADLKVKIGKLELKNPVMTASGTCGFGPELEDFFDPSLLGALVMKGTTLENREGNPYPRMAETPSGMLNAVGLQNKGIRNFIDNIYPAVRGYNTNMIVNVNGATIDEYVELSAIVNELDAIPAIELNISCPNVKMGGMAFGTHLPTATKVIRAVRKVYNKTLIVKLSPNVTSITDFAKASEDEGADSVSLINTLLGIAIDSETRKPLLSTITGGLSGPAVKPVALRMVWQVAKVVNIPVIGIGGIMNATDAVEFMLAGATAVQVGTAIFIEPDSPLRIVEGLNDYLDKKGFASAGDLIGALV